MKPPADTTAVPSDLDLLKTALEAQNIALETQKTALKAQLNALQAAFNDFDSKLKTLTEKAEIKLNAIFHDELVPSSAHEADTDNSTADTLMRLQALLDKVRKLCLLPVGESAIVDIGRGELSALHDTFSVMLEAQVMSMAYSEAAAGEEVDPAQLIQKLLLQYGCSATHCFTVATSKL